MAYLYQVRCNHLEARVGACVDAACLVLDAAVRFASSGARRRLPPQVSVRQVDAIEREERFAVVGDGRHLNVRQR
eukprot:scaffold46438_cov29-Tisochrysis_lutea.AAC.5